MYTLSSRSFIRSERILDQILERLLTILQVYFRISGGLDYGRKEDFACGFRREESGIFS